MAHKYSVYIEMWLMNFYKPTQRLIIQTMEQFALQIKTHKYNACGKMVHEFKQAKAEACESK